MDYIRQTIEGFTDHNMVVEYEVYDETYTYQISVVDPLPGGDGGAVVKYGNYYYRTLINDNTGFPPEDNIGTKWIRWGVSNAYAMLDLQAQSKSYWAENFRTVVDYRATTASQVVNLLAGDIVYNTITTDYWEAVIDRSTIDLDTDIETYVEGANWTAYTSLLVEDVAIGDVVYELGVGYWKAITARSTVDLNAEDYGAFIDYIATTATQVVTLAIDDIVYNAVTDEYWKSLLVRASIDLATGIEVYEEGVNWTAYTNVSDWTVSANDMVVEFDRGDIDTLVIGNYSASTITVVALDDVGDPIPSSEQTQVYGPNYDVDDYYSYIYSLYTSTTGLDAVFQIPFIGLKIRVTFHNNILGGETSCGFLIGGQANYMGVSLYGVGFSFNSYSVKETDVFGVTTILKRGVQELVDFETEITSQELMTMKRKIKLIYDEIVVFIVDPDADSVYENIITLGIVDNVSTVLNNPVQSIISWSVQEVI